VEKNMEMISNYTKRLAGVLKQYSEDYPLDQRGFEPLVPRENG
jgi:hypothetical protein